ncbi:MFS transporter [Subtercola sp. YIM 133946]|uniref:MFS transporter n=1 Tax=Subtercola sp. YIM 133946 TaxID=3118909 RepID=UPI002F930ACB
MSDSALPVRTSGTSQATPRPARSKWLALVIIALAQLTVVLDGTIVNVALPDAQAALGMSDSDRSWVVTLYALAFGSLLLLGGRIADYWGRKRSFIVGMAGFALASGIGGLATTGGMLLAARGAQGVFAALLAPAALAMLNVTFPKGPDRAKAFAVYGTIAGGGAAIGLVLGGVLTEYFSWHWCLLVNVPIAIVAIAMAIPILTESKADGDTRYDVPGALLVTLGLGSIVYGFSRASLGWDRLDTIGFLALGVALLVVFVLVEGRVSNPLLPLRVVANRVRGGAYITSLLVGAALLGGLLYLTLYFQIVLKFTPLHSGLSSLPMTASIIAGATIVSRILPKVGPRILMTIGPVFAAGGLFWLSHLTVENEYFVQILPGQILLGLGLAMVFVPMQNVALSGIEARDSGVGSAAVTATQQIGGSIGTAVFTAIYSSAVAAYVIANPSQNPLPSLVSGYSSVFMAASITVLCAAPIAFILVNVKRRAFAGSQR